MPRKATGQVIRRPNGSIEVVVPMGTDPKTGKRMTKSRSLPPGATDDQAEALRKKLLAGAKRQRNRTSRSTMAGLLEEYFAQQSPAWTPNEIRETRRKLDTDVIPALGAKSLAKLGASDIDAFYRKLRQRGLAESSVHRYHTILHAALALGVRWDWIERNPTDKATLHALDEVEEHPPTPEEAIALLAAADAISAAWGTFIRISAASGCRRGEMCGLLREGVRDDSTLHIYRVAGRGPDGVTSWERTKGKRRRVIPIGEGAFAVLGAHLAAMDARAADGDIKLGADAYVWSNEPDCSKPWAPDVQTKRWTHMRNKLGLTHVRLNDLRHYAGTQITELTGNQKLAQAQLGHRYSATTDRYVKVVPASLREAAEKLDRTLVRPTD